MTDETAFAAQLEPHRRELQVHCYRMLGSFDEAEDLVQETFLRAWRKRALRGPRHAPRVAVQDRHQRLLDEVAASGPDPAAAIVAKETIELAFLVAIQHLPARQRAALILRDGPPRVAPDADPSEYERDLLARFMDAHERHDATGMAEMLREDARVTMPPMPYVYVGIEAMRPLWERAFDEDEFGEWRLVPTRVNRQPAAASYLRRRGQTEFSAFKLDVLRIEGDRIAEITTFGMRYFTRLGLAATL